ncbi:IgGFc-binding protein-like [Patiria miniata]|uniref:IgGFc-binding protein N-terminal domain-containing protein n=1 Tax=Patiria miniata TaxID=46514 RepID=A0A914AJ60_PATMI|nr:IgGFc-binding protein-like [Patiria miniata]
MDVLSQQRMKTMLLMIVCLSGLHVITGTPGNQFIVGFMENVESKFPPKLVIGGNPHTSSNVTVTCPGLNFSQSFEVLKLEAVRVEIPTEAVNIGTDHYKNGILIDSSADITVYGLNTASANSMDGFTALPTRYLGVEYQVISTNVSNLLPSDQRWSEFLIIGVFDNTTVEVLLMAPTFYQNVSYNIGETLKIRVSRLETIQLQSQRDLTGTRVISSRPIAVMSGSKCANIPVDIEACDHLVEFIPPTNRLGREFILPTFLSRMAGDQFRLIGFEPQTAVTIAAPSIGNFTVQLGAGEFYTFELHSLESGYVTSSRPIIVAQYSQGAFADGGVKGDPTMLLVTPINQWLRAGDSAVVFSTYDVTADGLKPVQSYVTVTSRCSFTEDIIVDGRPLSVPKELVTVHPSRGEVVDFCVMRSPLRPGVHVISAVNSDAAFAAYVYGFGQHIAYAFPLGISGQPLSDTAPPNATTYRPNQERNTVCLGANTTHWTVISILIFAVCVLIICSLVLWRKLKAITVVMPMRTDKPRPIDSNK